MKPDKQRLAIAEYCGWAGFEVTGHILLGVPPQNEITEKLLGPKTITGWTPRFDVPDYPNDLNAMHEAEKCLPKYPKNNYGDHGPNKISYSHLLEVELCPKDRFGERDNATLFQFIHATAAQKAKAFLRTIGKWEE